MRVKDILTIARLGLCRNKLLSAFIIAGMTAGVVITGLVAGFGVNLAKDMLGYDLRVPADRIAVLWTPLSAKMVAEPGDKATYATDGLDIRRRSYLLASDARDIKSEMPDIKTSVLLVDRGMVQFPNSIGSMAVLGTTEEFAEILPIDLCSGSLFTATDLTHQAPVCLITKDIAEREFAGREQVGSTASPAGAAISPVGATITVAGCELTIIGVIQREPGAQIPVGGELGKWRYIDSAIVVPWTTMAYRLRSGGADTSGFRPPGHAEQCMSITIALSSVPDFSKLKDTVNYLARTKWGLIEDSYRLLLLRTMIASLNTEGMLILVAVLFVASIALVVACLNSVNFSVASVAERRKEIGIRKAFGATNKRILLEVVLEVAVFGAIAGVLAIPVVYVAAGLFNEYLRTLGSKDDFILVDWSTILFILLVSVGAAALAGLVPARTALQIEVAEALQVER
jgi:putative ABC transport system permease protein